MLRGVSKSLKGDAGAESPATGGGAALGVGAEMLDGTKLEVSLINWHPEMLLTCALVRWFGVV